MTDNGESEQEMESRHRKEVKGLEGEKRAAVKKAKALKGKKGKDALANLEVEFEEKQKKMKERHEEELSKHRDNGDNENETGDTKMAAAAEQDGNSASQPSEGTAATDSAPATQQLSPDEEARQRKQEKARRKRDAKKEKERQRQREIEEETANAGPSPREVENQQILTVLQPLHLTISEVAADGHCLYRAVAAQLSSSEEGTMDYTQVRSLCAQSLREHEDEFAPFVEYNDTTAPDFSSYCHRVQHSADWGGHVELRVLATALKRPIHVYSAGNTTAMTIGEEGDGNANAKPILLSYHLHYYALGEHYNQVVPM